MIAWVVLMRILCSGSMRYTRIPGGGRAYKVPVMVSVLTMGYIVFWIGMSCFMADSTAYIRSFIKTVPDLSKIPDILDAGGRSVLWDIHIILFKALVSDYYQTWLMALTMLMGFSIAHWLKKYSEAFFFSLLLFVLNTDFTWMYNGIRQFTCVTILLLAFPWLTKGETKKYLALVAILSQVHFSVLIMIPIYFVVRQKPWSKLLILSIFAVCGICAFSGAFADSMETVLEHTSYKGASIISKDDDGAHPVRALILAVPAILAWINRKRIEAENNPVLNICVNLSLQAALLMFIAVFTSGIMMGRLAIYCSIYSFLTLPMVIARWPNKQLRTPIQLACVVCYGLYFSLEMRGGYYYSILTGHL